MNTGFLTGKVEFPAIHFSHKRQTMLSPRKITPLLISRAWAEDCFVNTPEPFRFFCFLKIANHAVMANYDLSLGERGMDQGWVLSTSLDFSTSSSRKQRNMLSFVSLVKQALIKKKNNSKFPIHFFMSHITPLYACNSSSQSSPSITLTRNEQTISSSTHQPLTIKPSQPSPPPNPLSSPCPTPPSHNNPYDTSPPSPTPP